MRSGACASAPHATHQARMSASERLCPPCSTRETFVKWNPVASASWRPDRPASRRISRRRLPNASLARRSLPGGISGGLVLAVRDAELPHGIECRGAQLYVMRVGAGDEVGV